MYLVSYQVDDIDMLNEGVIICVDIRVAWWF